MVINSSYCTPIICDYDSNLNLCVFFLGGEFGFIYIFRLLCINFDVSSDVDDFLFRKKVRTKYGF